MYRMRCRRTVQTFEGNLMEGDEFSVGYEHERVGGKLTQTVKIPWINPAIRAIELRKLEIATSVELLISEDVPPVAYGYAMTEEPDPKLPTEEAIINPVANVKRRTKGI